MSYNRLSDLRTFESNTLRTISWLALDGNQITDVGPLQNLVNLTFLALTTNQIIDPAPLASLSKLENLHLSGNAIPKDKLGVLHKALPNCKIHF